MVIALNELTRIKIYLITIRKKTYKESCINKK